MGCNCSKHDDFCEDPSRINRIDLLEGYERNYSNKILSFSKEFETNINHMKHFQLVDFINILNNFNFNFTASTKKFLDESEIEDNDFLMFFNNKITNSALMPNLDEIHQSSFQKFILFIYDNIKEVQASHENFENVKNLPIPKYLITTIGFNYCNYKLSQKVNIFTNLLCNEEGMVTKNNPNLQKILECYIKNAVIIPVKFLLNEIEIENKDVVDYWLSRRNLYNIKTYFSNLSPEGERIALTYKIENKTIDIDKTFSLFFKDLITKIFDSAEKKEYTKQEFKHFLSDEKKGGGLWLLFNEGIRNEFEIFIENQDNN